MKYNTYRAPHTMVARRQTDFILLGEIFGVCQELTLSHLLKAQIAILLCLLLCSLSFSNVKSM